MDRPLTACRSTTVEEGRPETYSPGESSRKVKEGQDKVKTRSRQGQDKVKTLLGDLSQPPVTLVSHFFVSSGVSFAFSLFFLRKGPTMADISDDKAALAYLLKQEVLWQMQMCRLHSRSSRPGFKQPQAQCRLRFRKTCPSRMTIQLKVRIRQRKTSHYSPQKCAESEDLKTTFVIT